VLLRGVNDEAEVMKTLVQKLLRCRVRPYYLYQCDLIQGSSHLRTSVSKGIEIMENLRGHTTGYAIPQYVIDGPGGGGKIPINPNYVVAQMSDRIVLRNYKGDIYEYPDVATPASNGIVPDAPRLPQFFDPIEEREEITSRSWRAGRRD
jgi:lysine 2,3-aminomutase